MPRGAQVIYPKDLGPILVLADIFPGARILESGVGSGALTTALLRAIGPTGHVTGYEIRDDFAQRAIAERARVPRRPTCRSTVEVRDVYDGIEERDLDRILLDLPEPWRVVKHALESLAARRHPARVPADDPPGRPAARGARRTRRSAWSRRSRCCSAAGTSRASRSGPTTAWSRTPASSPTAACWRAIRERRRARGERARPRRPRTRILGATVGGWRLGFVARVLAWAGVVVGLVIGVALRAARRHRVRGRPARRTGPRSRCCSSCSWRRSARRSGSRSARSCTASTPDAPAAPAVGPARRRRARRVRRARAAVDGHPVVRDRRRAGRPAWRAARRSSPRSSAGRRTQPARFAAWGRAISDAPFPSALGTLQSPPNPGPPPGTSITPAVDARVRASTVKVDRTRVRRRSRRGAAGSRRRASSSPTRTSSRGSTRPPCQDASGPALPATVDRVRSRARRRRARRARSLRPRRRSRWPTARSASVGAVYGHPGGGPLRGVAGARRRRDPRGRHRHLPHRFEPAARVRARRDARARRLRRRARERATATSSGWPSPSTPAATSTAYALTDAEIRPVLARRSNAATARR